MLCIRRRFHAQRGWCVRAILPLVLRCNVGGGETLSSLDDLGHSLASLLNEFREWVAAVADFAKEGEYMNSGNLTPASQIRYWYLTCVFRL
jgi:hypothetical protein